MTVGETDALGEQGVRVLEPCSTLISCRALIGAGTIVYPTLIIDADDRSYVETGRDCVLYPGTVLEAREGGRIQVGAAGQLGPGGVTIRVGRGESVSLGAQVRLGGGYELTGICELGQGAQILGAISARSVRLAGGAGGYRWPVADERGAVLKGTGVADAITLAKGEVKSRRGSFAEALTEHQSAYHPDAR